MTPLVTLESSNVEECTSAKVQGSRVQACDAERSEVPRVARSINHWYRSEGNALQCGSAIWNKRGAADIWETEGQAGEREVT